jgi:Cu-Zn family superoxide dismutase
MPMSWRELIACFAAASLSACPALAADLRAQMQRATPNGPGESVGTVTIVASPGGAQFKAELHGLPPGRHGFHVHENGSCSASSANGQVTPAGAAGGHFDPGHTGHHEGPMKEGHLGDLPLLTVDQHGIAQETLTAPRIKDAQALKGHALMIHAGGDNYSDQPQPLGGGGARIACGVIE